VFNFKSDKINVDWFNIKEHVKMLEDLEPQLIKMFESADIPMQRHIQANLNLMYKVKIKLKELGEFIE